MSQAIVTWSRWRNSDPAEHLLIQRDQLLFVIDSAIRSRFRFRFRFRRLHYHAMAERSGRIDQAVPLSADANEQ